MERSFAARLGRPLAVPGLAHGLRLHLPVRLQSRRTLLIALLAVGVLAGGWMLLRDSPLVAVEHVQVSGVSGPSAGAIEAALTSEATHMSTLHVNVGALEEAVAPLHLVRALRVSTSFPHGLHIYVSEQLPVAVLVAGGERTAVAADGVVLGPAFASKSLAVLQAPVDPLQGRRVTDRQLLPVLTVLGAAPAPLLKLIARAYTGAQGLTVAMRNGLLAYFGDATRPHAKWDALAAVLSAPTSRGASYIDVRLPERPAAGGALSSSGEASTTEVSATDPTAAALAATLAEAVSGAPQPTTAPPAEAQSSPSESAPIGSTPGAATTSTPAEG
jgi:cell division protein FtsQ